MVIGDHTSRAISLAAFLLLSLGRNCAGLATDIVNPAKVVGSIDPVVELTQTGSTGVPPYEWFLLGNELQFVIGDSGNLNTASFEIQAGSPAGSLYVSNAGSLGFGTLFPNFIGGAPTTGRILNLRTDAAGTAGLARIVAQGASGGQLHLVHNNGPVNQRICRMQNVNGIFAFNIVKDDTVTNAVTGALVIKNLNGNIGLKQLNPVHPLHLASGAHCTAGGSWTDASSRDVKQGIQPLSSRQAQEAVRALQPVEYCYKEEPDDFRVGFIAEDVPELVATKDRKSLAPMDIVAVLTTVVQDQQQQLEQKTERIDRLESLVNDISHRLAQLEAKSHEKTN